MSNLDRLVTLPYILHSRVGIVYTSTQNVGHVYLWTRYRTYITEARIMYKRQHVKFGHEPLAALKITTQFNVKANF